MLYILYIKRHFCVLFSWNRLWNRHGTDLMLCSTTDVDYWHRVCNLADHTTMPPIPANRFGDHITDSNRGLFVFGGDLGD